MKTYQASAGIRCKVGHRAPLLSDSAASRPFSPGLFYTLQKPGTPSDHVVRCKTSLNQPHRNDVKNSLDQFYSLETKPLGKLRKSHMGVATQLTQTWPAANHGGSHRRMCSPTRPVTSCIQSRPGIPPVAKRNRRIGTAAICL